MASLQDPHLDPRIPNFFLAGAPKAGTTSLYHYLRQHPQVFLSPIKEPAYFASELRLENFIPEVQAFLRKQLAASTDHTTRNRNVPHPFIHSWDDYLALFRNANGATAIGEASVSYLWSKSAAQNIAARNPRAKVMLILRHPADRAYSQYLHAVSDARVSHSFRRHIAEGLHACPGKLSFYHPFLEYGLYSDQVERFFACFPRQQVRIWLYEDTLADPARFHREVLAFLGVDSSFSPDATRRLHRMETPRALALTQPFRRSRLWPALRAVTPAAARPLLKKVLYHRAGEAPPMNSQDRALLLEYYHEDIRRLQRVIERDLHRWLQ